MPTYASNGLSNRHQEEGAHTWAALNSALTYQHQHSYNVIGSFICLKPYTYLYLWLCYLCGVRWWISGDPISRITRPPSFTARIQTIYDHQDSLSIDPDHLGSQACMTHCRTTCVSTLSGKSTLYTCVWKLIIFLFGVILMGRILLHCSCYVDSHFYITFWSLRLDWTSIAYVVFHSPVLIHLLIHSLSSIFCWFEYFLVLPYIVNY